MWFSGPQLSVDQVKPDKANGSILVSDFVIKKVDEVSLSLLPKPTAKKNEKPNGYVLKCVSAEECTEWLEFLTNPLLSGGGGGQVFGKALASLPADENGIPKVLLKIIAFLSTHGKNFTII